MTIRIGILGAAAIAPSALVEPASDLPGVEVTAIAARDIDRAKTFATEYRIPRVAATYADLIESSDIDAIYIPLPTSHHRYWSIAALRAGKHVLCEKPFAANAGEAAEMVAVAEQTGLVLCEALHWRYHPIADRILHALEGIGPIRRIEAVFCGSIPSTGDIRYDIALAGGALMDLGCYPVHWIRTFARAEPEVVSATAIQGPPGIDVAMEAELRLPGPIRALIRTAMTEGSPFEARLEIEAKRGSIKVDNPVLPHWWNSLTIEAEGETSSADRVEGPSTYRCQLEAFADAVTNDTPLPTGGDDAIASMRLIDAIYEAARLPRREGI